MRLLHIVLLATSIFFHYGSGFEINERALTVADIPPCGLNCLLQVIPAVGCGLSDTECQCASKELTTRTSDCILANCTMADSLGTAKVQADLCNLPHESQTGLILASMTTVFAIMCFFSALRFATRILTKRVRADDWCILGALCFGTVTYTTAVEMARYNFGKHLYDLRAGDLEMALKYFYVGWNSYVITLGLVKVSLVAFYLQVFHERRFRIVCWIVIGFITLSTVIIQFLTIFCCTPVHSFWDRDIKGKCLNVGAIGFANSALAITQDLIIIILPMHSLLKLQMKRWRKIAVGFMFAVGAFGCITTTIRMRSLAGFKISFDPTWDYTNVIVWTGAELAAGIVCASLPAVRQLLLIILPSGFHRFLTNRSRSRSNAGADRGRMASGQHRRKRSSLFAMPSMEEQEKGSFSATTNTWTPSWTKSQARSVEDIEQGGVPAEQKKKKSVWNPLLTLFPKQTRGFEASFWSSVDRSGSPAMQNYSDPTRRPNVTGFRAQAPRTEVAETTGKASIDEHVELLQVPDNVYRTLGRYGSEYDDITALPRIGILPDEEYLRCSPPQYH